MVRMCRSKQQGGRRCKYHLQQGVTACSVMYAVAATGLTRGEAIETQEALIREGTKQPDPSREEVDAFLTQEDFRIRHDQDLEPGLRAKLSERLQAAIGRVTPDGATFHAWKNLVAQAWAKGRRKVAAAFLVSSLSFGLGACGSAGNSEPAEPVGTVGQVGAPVTPGTFDSDFGTPSKPSYSEGVVNEFGQPNVDQAVDEALTLVEDESFRSDLLRSEDTYQAGDFNSATSHMTDTCAADYRKQVAADLADTDDGSGVQLIAFHDISGVQWHTDGPKTVDPKINKVKVSVADDGKRIEVHVDSQATMRYLDTGKPYHQNLIKGVTYWMKSTPNGWKVDGWAGEYGLGKMLAGDAGFIAAH